MGQRQSQQAEAPMSEWDPSISPEERAQAQAELRAKQQAALDKRIAPRKKKVTMTASVAAEPTPITTAPEQLGEDSERSVPPELASVSVSGPEQDPELTPEEQAEAQAELRAKQQAALDKRLAAKQKKLLAATSVSGQAKRKQTALEQASKENVGYRNMDSQLEYRSWN